MAVSIKVEGLEALKKKFGSLPKNVTDSLGAELRTVAEAYQNKAHESSPANHGLLRNLITVTQVSELNFEVVSGAPYSAFMEFGTRTKVSVPAELSAYASQFRNAKSTGDAKKEIFDWCKSKGIPKEAWYPIFIKIMTVGVTPHPFFFIHLPWAQTEVQKKS
jgi:hypothetical protein